MTDLSILGASVLDVLVCAVTGAAVSHDGRRGFLLARRGPRAYHLPASGAATPAGLFSSHPAPVRVRASGLAVRGRATRRHAGCFKSALSDTCTSGVTCRERPALVR